MSRKISRKHFLVFSSSFVAVLVDHEINLGSTSSLSLLFFTSTFFLSSYVPPIGTQYEGVLFNDLIIRDLNLTKCVHVWGCMGE